MSYSSLLCARHCLPDYSFNSGLTASRFVVKQLTSYADNYLQLYILCQLKTIYIDRYFCTVYKVLMNLLTTAQVAERLGVHRTRVNVLIREGRLPAHQFGRAYLVDEKDLALVAERTVGRPPKSDKKTTARSKNRRDRN